MSYITNARGLRLGKFRKWKTTWYFEQKEYVQNIHDLLNIQKYIENIFSFLKSQIFLIKLNYINIGKKNIYIILSYYTIKDSNKNYKFIKNLKNKIPTLKTQKINYYKNYYKNKKLIKSKYFLKNNLNKKLFFIFNYNSKIKKQILKKKFLKLKTIKKIKKNNNKNIKIQNKTLFLKNILEVNKTKNNNFYNNLKKNYEDNIIKYSYNKNYLNQIIFKNYLVKSIKLKKNKLNNYKIKWIIYKNFILYIITLLYLNKNNIKQNIKNDLSLILKRKLLRKKKKFFKNNFVRTDNIKILNTKLNYKKNKTQNNNNKRLIIKNLNNIKNELSILCNSNINIILINSLNLLHFHFKNYSKNFLDNLLYKKTTRFKQETKNVKDIVFLIMISFFFKDAELLAKILNFVFKTSKKKAKHWRLINFIKLILSKVSSFYNDIDAYKIKIKGRINHSRRKRFIYIQKNLIPNQTFNNFIDYGYQQTKTKSGSLGIKVWIFLKKDSINNYRKTLIEYINYSKLIKELKNV